MLIINDTYKKLIILGYIFILIPFLSIYGIRSLIGQTASQQLLIWSLYVFLIIVFIRASHIRMGLSTISMILYNIVIISSTIIFHGFSAGIFVSTLAYLSVFLTIQTSEYENILSALYAIVLVVAIVNFISLFTVVETFAPMYFIGGKNAFAIFLIPGMCLVMLRSMEKHNKITKPCIFLSIICLISIFVGASATGIVVALAFVILYWVIINHNFNKYIILFVILTCYLLLLFSENFLQSELWMDITDMLGKESSLTSRADIWEYTLRMIKESPILGNGRGGTIGYINEYGLYDTKTEAHNFIIEILFEGGLVALVLYLTMLIKIIFGLNMDNKKHRVLFFAICMVLINGLTESTVNNFFVIVIMAIGCRFSTLEKGET